MWTFESSTKHPEILTDLGLLEIYAGYLIPLLFHIPGSYIKFTSYSIEIIPGTDIQNKVVHL